MPLAAVRIARKTMWLSPGARGLLGGKFDPSKLALGREDIPQLEEALAGAGRDQEAGRQLRWILLSVSDGSEVTLVWNP
jgi:hypothetical protein